MYGTISVPLLRQYAVVITVNLLALCVGMDMGWASPALVKLRDPAQLPLSRPITDDEGGWIVSIGFIFSAFTLPCIGLLMDCIGRRYSILVACLPKIVAGVVMIFATEVWMLLTARIINGATSTGGLMIIMKEIRGSLGIILSILSNLGVLVMLGIGPYISYRNLNIMVCVVTVCACIPLLFIPDTPYSLYTKDKIEEARKVLICLRGSQALAEEELKEFSVTKPNQKFDIREILKNKAYVKALVMVVVIGLGLQLVGFNFISFYLQTILELSNTSVSPALGSVIIGVIQLASSVIASVVIDRFGRKPILTSALFTVAVGMSGLGMFFVIKQHGIISGFLNYLPLICLAIVTSSFSGGIGCLYFVIVTELLDGPIRAMGSAMSAVVTFLMLFLLLRFATTILSAVGAAAIFFTFGVICVVMALYVLFFVPETKQKSIAEIQRALGGLKEQNREDCVSRL